MSDYVGSGFIRVGRKCYLLEEAGYIINDYICADKYVEFSGTVSPLNVHPIGRASQIKQVC